MINSQVAIRVKRKKTKSPTPRKSSSPEQWTRVSQADGSSTFRLASWSQFFDFLEAEVFEPSTSRRHSYIWRGQRNKDWKLSSSLDRLLGELDLLKSDDLPQRLKDHLESFKYATRGRRGPTPAALLENDWWALGQHFGLATPLLDWTRSPFAAAYFAFELNADPADYRVVYGLDQNAVKLRNNDLLEGESLEKGRPSVIEFIDPMSDENQRLVSQGGLFTRAPVGISIEQWVEEEFGGSSATVLLKIEIPDKDRVTCLQTLERMNINHLSLFPDLSGASRYTNLKLALKS
jgi:FRG domain-containing protein